MPAMTSQTLAPHADTAPPIHGRQPETPLRYDGPTYYGRPTVKPSKYHALVWSYTFVAGLAGGAQLIAALADRARRRRPRLQSVVRHGRYLALSGPAIGSVLLIADLHTPQRWYNMLRIFRKTSPMSIGTYILSSFSVSSMLAAAAQWFGGRRVFGGGVAARVAAVADVPAAASGAGMTMYTGALLSATSTPAWAAAPRLLTARFACSAIATGAAALSLCEHTRGDARNTPALDRIAAVATVAGIALAGATAQHPTARRLEDAMQETGKSAMQHALSEHLGHTLPLVCQGLNELLPGRSRGLSILASLGVLAGGMLMRAAVFDAGNASAARPGDYLGFTEQAPDRRLPS